MADVQSAPEVAVIEAEFRRRLVASNPMAGTDYGIGYQHGLRCNYFGVVFNSAAVHERWLRLRGELGDGYRDGFAGKMPREYA